MARPLTARRPVPSAAVLVAPVVIVTVLFVTALACGLGAWAGAWWVPFLAGVAAGALGPAGSPAGHRVPRVVPRGGVLAASAGAVLGWGIPLWVLALRGQPAGATARAIAALAGLPPHAAVAVVVTLLLAALQVLAGAWLARAVMPPGRPQAAPGPPPAPAPQVTGEPQP